MKTQKNFIFSVASFVTNETLEEVETMLVGKVGRLRLGVVSRETDMSLFYYANPLLNFQIPRVLTMLLCRCYCVVILIFLSIFINKLMSLLCSANQIRL